MTEQTYRKVVVQETARDPHSALKIVEVAMGEPGPGELLVRNYYAGVNYTDLALMMGLTDAGQHLPFDFGAEAIGEVVAIGSGITNFQRGDIVLTGLPGNGYREYSRISQGFAMKVPAMKPEYVGLFISGSAAKIASESLAEIGSGQTVLVTVGCGSVGHYLVQLARLAGNHVISTCHNETEATLLQELGVDRIIDRSQEDVTKVLQEEYENGLQVVFEAFGGSILDAALKQAAPLAKIVLLETLHEHFRSASAVHQVNFYEMVIRKSVKILGFTMSDYAQNFILEAGKMIDLYERGEIRSIIDDRLFSGLESVPDALAHLMSGEGYGKTLVQLVDEA
ncbi:MAG: zinc-binding dehydrogenase [Anaerolineae bacterium]|nr:zinc-binding dehydrogenase [Anaerolineae bacterium]